MPIICSIKKASQFILLAFLILFTQHAHSASYLTIIIDDIGHNDRYGKMALSLNGDITYALLPYSTHASELAQKGLKNNKEFILHSPMQSIDNRLVTQHTLHIHMSELQFRQQLNAQLAQFPFVKGVNNHMGSLLTIHPGYMSLLMRELKNKPGFFFVDSRTTTKSVANKMAKEHNIPSLQRDVFLDNDQAIAAINEQFDLAISISQLKGHAVVIGHPYRNTIRVLKKRLAELSKHNIELISASSLINKLKERADEKSPDSISAGM